MSTQGPPQGGICVYGPGRYVPRHLLGGIEADAKVSPWRAPYECALAPLVRILYSRGVLCPHTVGGCTHLRHLFWSSPPPAMCVQNILENEILASHTTLRAGGPARYFFRIRNEQDLIEALAFAKEQELPWYVLGGGSNVLFSDQGFPGVVLHMENEDISYENIDTTRVRAVVGAGYNWDAFVRDTVERRLWGIENLSLIPGTVGAAPVQNIWAYGPEVGEYIEWVEVFDAHEREKKTYLHDECAFAYRTSLFKENPHLIIIRVAFVLSKKKHPQVEYKDVAEKLKEKGITDPSIEDMRNILIDIRTKKLPDIRVVGNAGSFFKNPIVTEVLAEKLHTRFLDMPLYHTPHGAKLSAAWLIDHVGGWKGYKEGHVGVHDRQALVLVHDGEGSAQDILSLSKKIADDVYEKTRVRLEPEVQCVGSFS